MRPGLNYSPRRLDLINELEPDLDHIKRRLRELEELEEQDEDPEQDRLARTLLILDGEIRHFLRNHLGISSSSAANREGYGLGLLAALAVVFLVLGMWIAVYNPSSDVVEAISGENEQINLRLGEEAGPSAQESAVERAASVGGADSSSDEEAAGDREDAESGAPEGAR